MQTLILWFLNAVRMYTSLIYNFLIEVPNKNSIPLTQHLTKKIKWDPLMNYQ